MSKYHVTYYYLATGMEGNPDVEDYGIYEANSKDEAIDLAIKEKHPIDKIMSGNFTQNDWIKGCLTATELQNSESVSV